MKNSKARSGRPEEELSFPEALHFLPVPAYICDADGYIRHFNSSAVSLWGRIPVAGEELWTGSWKTFDPLDNSLIPHDQCPMSATLRDGNPVVDAEIIIERPDGTRRHVTPHPRPLFGGDGKLLGAVNVLIDITRHKQTLEALHKSESQFRNMTNVVPVVLWQCDAKGMMTYLSTQWNRHTNQPVEEGLGDKWLLIVHPDEQDRVQKEWLETIKYRQPLDLKFRYASLAGSFHKCHARGNPVYDHRKKFTGYIGIIQDITSFEEIRLMFEKEMMKRTEDLVLKNEELRKSEERYHRMVAEVEDYAIILLDREGNIENWNKGAEKIKGYSADDIVGKNFSVFYREEDRANGLPGRLLQTAVDTGRASHEGWRLRKDGTMFWGSIVLTALHDEDNNVTGFSKVTRDLTERKTTEDRLQENALQLEKKNQLLQKMNHELEAFAYVSSHDLQEPLRKILTLSSRIMEMDKERLSEKSQDYFRRMREATFRMRALIDDLLAYSHTNVADRKFEVTGLDEVIQKVRQEMAEQFEEKNAILETEPLPAAYIIPFQFHQLFVNLFSNALKFSNPDVPPVIQVTYEIVPGSELQFEDVGADASYLHIRVTDNGIGFEPEYSKHIFEVFQRLHTRSEFTGTGVGLAICKKIAYNHNGFITAEGEPGRGATFHLYLPHH